VEGHEYGGYEAWRAKSSFLATHAGPKMVTSALRQLEKLAWRACWRKSSPFESATMSFHGMEIRPDYQ
jgi:hypothetical protein